jgi:probable F420-dependent oxidoreductase
VAKQAAELDLLTGGRLRLGVGIGRNWMEYEALNENFRNRGRRVEEQVEVLRRLWTDELVTFEGKWHHLDRMGLNPMPVQRPIPIWFGTYTQLVENAIKRVARIGDGWFPQFPPNDEFRAVLERFRGYIKEAGRDPADVGIEAGISAVRGDPDGWAQQAQAWRELGATHIRVNTMGANFDSPQQYIDAAVRCKAAIEGA